MDDSSNTLRVARIAIAIGVGALTLSLAGIISTMQDNRVQIEELINRVATLEVEMKLYREHK